VTCPGTSAAAGCVPGNLIDPNMISTSISVPLDAACCGAPTAGFASTLTTAGTQLTPRTNQVDFGVAKRLKFGRVRFDPRVDLFNAFNSDDYYAVVSSVFSPTLGPNGVSAPAVPANAAGTNYTAYHQPARFLQGRIVKIGFNASW